VWRLAPSFDALELAAARALRTGIGPWLTVRESFVGLIRDSQYVAKPTSQEQSMFTGERSRYLIVYPFTKSTDWYLTSREIRQGSMNEHMRVGHQYPQVRQLLAYSFGLDDQDFVVAYETDDLSAFSALVRDLRGTDGRRSTVRDTPILTGIHRPIREILGLLGAEPAAAPADAELASDRMAAVAQTAAADVAAVSDAAAMPGQSAAEATAVLEQSAPTHATAVPEQSSNGRRRQPVA
jgi:chlorite dismutase